MYININQDLYYLVLLLYIIEYFIIYITIYNCMYNYLGPSAVGQMFHRVETSNNVPELLIVSSSSSESDGECEIIGYVKPRHERTPEIIELLSSDSEHVSVSHISNGNMQ